MRHFMKKLSLCLAIGAVCAPAMAYNIVERATLVDDRFKTLELTRAIGHDFFFNLSATYSPDTLDMTDDFDRIDAIDTGSETQDIQEATDIMRTYFDKEQILRANLGLGFPLPSFTAFNTKIKPNFRVDAGIFAMLTPKSDTVSLTKLIANLDQVPANIRTQLDSCLTAAIAAPLANGSDLIAYCVGRGDITQAQADQIKDTYGITEIPFNSSYANTEVDAVAVDIYAKAEVKAGFFNTYKYDEHFFGDFNLYALGRLDIKKTADAILLVSGGGATDEFAENTLVNMVTDFMFGYKNSNYSVKAGFEELKLAEMSKEDDADLNFGDSALFRLHGQADYQLSVFKLSPYAGFHTRSGYGIGDAYYLGADWGVFVWNDRLGLNIKTQLDKEHITLGLRAKIWFMHADLTSKLPITDNVDGVDVSSYYGANLRFFF